MTFDNKTSTKIRVAKGIGDIVLHREISNWKTGDEFSTEWETKNIAGEGYHGLRFSILNRTPDDDVKMLAWNKEHPDDLYTDCVAIDHGVEAHVSLYLSPDRFHDLLNLNWREKYLEVSLETSPSIHGLKFTLEESDKTKMREGTFYNESGAPLTHRRLRVHTYEITVKDLPVVPSQERGHSLPLYPMREIKQPDIWLQRLSHISQFGLFIFTVWAIYFTVIPLYQKAFLEEAIAKKEVELKEANAALEGAYVRFKAMILNDFVFMAVLSAPACYRILRRHFRHLESLFLPHPPPRNGYSRWMFLPV
ncbi:MAG: hypothetical protein ABI988_18025 [Nitrospirota bacterium]